MSVFDSGTTPDQRNSFDDTRSPLLGILLVATVTILIASMLGLVVLI